MGALEVFTTALERIVREGGRPREIVSRARGPLARLAAERGWLAQEHTRLAGGGEPAAHLLAKADDDVWSVVTVVFPAGATTPVHDHLIWGLVAVYTGVEEETAYRRLDDATVPGYARLEKVGVQRNGPGSIALVVPPEQEIHSIRNPGTTPSVSIHVYGGDLSRMPRHRFDVAGEVVYDYQAEYAKDEA